MKPSSFMLRPPLKRLSTLPARFLALPVFAWCIIGLVLFFGARQTQWGDRVTRLVSLRRTPRMPTDRSLPALDARISCYGPRGTLLSESEDDELRQETLSTTYPTPFSGSHKDLGVNLTWTTPDGRYGPYGFGEDESNYNRTKVDWDAVDWGTLQDDCLARNAGRFPDADKIPSSKFADDVRFSFWRSSRIPTVPQWNRFRDTRRTALVLRAYSHFDYKPEDMWFIRSLIAEASLRTGGEYVVCLLVNVQNENKGIFKSTRAYYEALEEAKVPKELRSITLLWDDNLLDSWYPDVGEHRTMWAVNQPLQLFSLHYPEFDHYWQIELDQRFLGDAGEYLDAVSSFARREPRKQGLERASFSFSEEVSGSYANFTRAVDAANDGRSLVWGPLRIPDVSPIGPVPPVPNPSLDDFKWGVGEDADAIVTSFCADVLNNTEWVFRDYIENFQDGTATPRWWCPPAIMRASRPLLLAVHQAQHDRGVSIPSEAVLPSFALWHGLKMVNVPQPSYMHDWQPDSEFLDETVRDRSQWRRPHDKPWFGWDPAESPDGLGHAEPQSFADRGLTWWWASNYPRRIMDVWLGAEIDAEDMPSMLAVRGGEVYAPNFAMHPVKT